MRWLSVVITIAAVLAMVKLVVWLLEPRMAFFPYAGVQETPSSFGLQFTDLKIPTADGETLHGWWMEHPSARAQVVYWHGNGGNLSLWLEVLAEIHRRGFSVMAVDYRGYGASTGRPSEQGIYRDSTGAIEYFFSKLRKPSVPTIYWGRSLGCAVASYTATRSAPAGLILESPFPDVWSLFAGNPVMRLLSLFSTYRFPTSRHLETYTGPLLVLHGDSDRVIPFENGRRVFERAPGASKRFVTIAGADHNDNFTRNAEYWRGIDDFASSLAR